MLILGINGGLRQGYQDVSACLIEDGQLIAAIEEERISRIKFSAGRLPFLSVLEVLKISNKKIQDIDYVAFHGSTWGDEFKPKLVAYFKNNFGFSPQIEQFHHHDCHAASAFFASGFKSSLVVTLDNSGDGVSLQVSLGNEKGIKPLKRFERPNSLGIFYSLITQYCGFQRDADEYKLMGLSSYGNKDKYDFSDVIDFQSGRLSINEEFIVSIPPKQPSPHKDEMLFSEAFLYKMKLPRRLPKSAIDSFYMDVAASAQAHFEKLMIKILLYYINETEQHKICFAGGSALNCVMNQKIMNLGEVDSLFVQPASSDAGISLGAAWLMARKQNQIPCPPENYYLGSGYSNEAIEEILKSAKLTYYFTPKPEQLAAEFIANNKVLGWFQGRSEFGPRALGNRSILANATNPDMQKIVNEKIKFREGFRPFCPSVLEEDFSNYFEGDQNIAPYMNITYHVKKDAREKIPAVCHIDNTARIQTVNEKQNKKFYDLLLALKQKTSCGVVLNTSFNLAHEPIVNSPRDAIATFYASGLDVLILGNYVLEK